VVELTPAGMKAWDQAAGIQGRKEAFFASALTKAEQKKLNDLLRKLMLAFEAAEPPA
jgi:DNA-binding MarR family transcriptional regulator